MAKEFVSVSRNPNAKYYEDGVVLGLYGPTGVMRQAFELSETQATHLRDELDLALSRIKVGKPAKRAR
jgi:hypothetical protein